MVRGIRNSFGIAWDPITGNLWDTENGPHFGDEINLSQLHTMTSSMHSDYRYKITPSKNTDFMRKACHVLVIVIFSQQVLLRHYPVLT